MGRPAKAKRLTEEEQRQVVARVRTGAPVSLLMEEFGTSRWFIERALAAAGSPATRGGYAAEAQE